MSSARVEQGGVRDRVGGKLVGRYRLERPIGRGGMATVYKGFDEYLGRPVALKIFRSERADAEDVRRQGDEVRLLASLNHPGLVTLFDAVTETGATGLERTFLVMEFVDGEDLRSRLLSGPLHPRAAALIGAGIADALEYTHGRGVVHRDIKPANILLPSGRDHTTGVRAKLADFGIARLVDGAGITATGSVLGTAGYLSPEQAIGEPAGPASDIYSLGLVLLEAVSGRTTFPGRALEAATARLSRDPEIPASLGEDWGGALRWMTSRTPDDRPDAASAADLLRRLASGSSPAVRSFADEETREYVVDANTASVAANSEILPATLASARVPLPAETGERTRTRLVSANFRTSKSGIPFVLTLFAAMLVSLAAWLLIPDSPGFVLAPPSTEIDYPTVDGELGEHLKQLQQSVSQ